MMTAEEKSELNRLREKRVCLQSTTEEDHKRMLYLEKLEKENTPRRLSDMTNAGEYFFANANSVIDAFKMAGEIKVVVDVLQWKGALTFHIPFPK